MQSTPRERLMQFGELFQSELFRRLEEEVGTLSKAAKLLVAVASMVQLERFLPATYGWRGRPSKDRCKLAMAFMARAVYGLATMRQVIQRLQSDRQLRCLCGWREAKDLPHESTFSRAFAEFAASELAARLHAALIEDTQKGRLIGHIARDSTAIEARERYPDPAPVKAQRAHYKKGPKAKRRTPRSPRSRIEEQRQMALPAILADLSRHCSLGVKKSSKGHLSYWRGYKLHLDVADGHIPITALITGASVHDSQVAVPLMNITSKRVTYLYDLMDAGYTGQHIREHSLALGHRPIVDPVQRYRSIARKVSLRKNSKSWKIVYDREPLACEFTPAEKVRFRERTMVERVFARLKDEFGARSIRVRGAQKIMAHLMFGVLALTVDQLLKLTG
jgi:transposase